MTAESAKAQKSRIWTVVELIRWTTGYLEEKGFEDARLQVERLLAHVLNCDRVGLYLQFDRPLTPEELGSFKVLLKRRLAREPLQYVLGECDFHGIHLKVDHRALIPRPETEQLVDRCLDLFAGRRPARVLDVGTGSGNIVLALAEAWPEAEFVAVDLSREALALAVENAQALDLANRIRFLEADVFSGEFVERVGRGFDLVVSNPPYVRPEEWSALQPEISRYEPRLALVAGPDGLHFYRRLAAIARGLLKKGGWLAVEIGDDQATNVRAIFEASGLQELATYQDLAGKDRVVIGRV